MTSIQELLAPIHKKLTEQYTENHASLISLQRTLLEDVIPAMNLPDENHEERAREYVSDFNAVFHMARKHNFTISFALEAIRKNIEWRLSNISTSSSENTQLDWESSKGFYLFPSTSRDPFNRPILVLNLHKLTVESLKDGFDKSRDWVILAFERFRMQLQRLNEEEGREKGQVFQCVVLLDLSEFTIRVMNPDFATYVVRELIPHFPGMLATVFMLNYSWAHSSMWQLTKRLLPKQALSRVFFPSQEELLQFFGRNNLPTDYGGTMPSCFTPPLRQGSASPSSSSSSSPPSSPSSPNANLKPKPRSPKKEKRKISPLSHMNPFFGYPTTTTTVSTSSGLTHHLQVHYEDKRRVVHLVRTLAFLFWVRWKKVILAFLVSCMLLGLGVGGMRGRLKVFGRLAFHKRT
ncbi:CRAL-TRIO domain-containing protein [Flagelloscypha sp. PMI_526]|nr:CRAL-TRIO domain-containing protein [Flagelloscypha sp. PMI_526]